MKAILYYIHDPMCSWCWGFSRVLKELSDNLPANVEIHRILGGLAPDTDLPMPDTMKIQIKNNWHRIEDTISGVKFNFEFWEKNIARRSTYPACRAVIAAREQGEENDIKMTKAIQNAYYKEARNPSDDSTLIELAVELNLSVEKFKKDLNSNAIKENFLKEVDLTQEIFVESFPSLVLKVNNEIHSINIDYNNSKIMIDAICEYIDY